MNIELQMVKTWGLSVALAVSAGLGLMSAPRAHAEDDGLYLGRSLTTGTPAAPRANKGQLALEPGSVVLPADVARLDSEAVLGAHRFDLSFASEGGQPRSVALALGSSGETLSLLPLGSLPLDGFYAGRSLTTGAPAAPRIDKGQLALEPGSVALGADAARLDSERVFGGYRFDRSFALEGAQTRFAAPAWASSGETLSLAAVSSLPLSDSVTLSAKFGLHYSQSTVIGADRSYPDLAGAGKLYGLGVSVQVAENVELRARSERFERSPTSPPGTVGADSFLFGANVRF